VTVGEKNKNKNSPKVHIRLDFQSAQQYYFVTNIHLQTITMCFDLYRSTSGTIYLKNGDSILMQNVSFVTFWLLYGLVYFEITNFWYLAAIPTF